MNLALVDRLLETLRSEGIIFCHWKSNLYFKESLLTEGRDLDLLVARPHVHAFERVLLSLGFKRAYDPLGARVTAISHFYGLDRATGAIAHLHVYYRIITGESLTKNYCFPFEDMLLQDLRIVDGVPMPRAAAELVVLVIRIMLKYLTPVEYLLMRRRDRSGYQVVRDEIHTLLSHDPAGGWRNLLAEWVPSVDRDLFSECMEALRIEASMPRCTWLAFRLSRQLHMYKRLSFMSAKVLRTNLLLKLLIHRLRGGGKSKQLVSGGRLIAFVGPEATGKSTLVNETSTWLGKVFDVKSAHLGKPPSTWLTFLPNLTLPLLRKVSPVESLSRAAVRGDDMARKRRVPLLYAVRAVLVAWDRRALAMRIRRKVTNGGVVICDRYPAATMGAMDGPRLRLAADSDGSDKLLSYLGKLETRLYRQVTPPDVVINVTVPVEVAIARNQERKGKREPDDYVRHRHVNTAVPTFPTAQSIDLDSNRPLMQTIESARRIVWDTL